MQNGPINLLSAVLILPIAAILAFGAAPPKINDPVEGQKLAAELRDAVPTEAVNFQGVLRIAAANSEAREIPIESKVIVKLGSWTSIYAARTAKVELEGLTVHHSIGKPNAYEWSHKGKLQKLSDDQATNTFAGSDFALMDLGLEFFHWPTQILVTREMRKGRGCDVLESRPAKTNLYSRVLSWIDQESRQQGQPGILYAEAYDKGGRLLKEFEIQGFKKGAVNKMELRNRQTKTSTRLTFDLDKQ